MIPRLVRAIDRRGREHADRALLVALDRAHRFAAKVEQAYSKPTLAEMRSGNLQASRTPEEAYGIAVHRTAFAAVRRAVRERDPAVATDPVVLAETLCAPATPGADIDAREGRVAVGEALGKLPPNHERALRLRHWHGLSYAEIAQTMGATVASVNNWIHRGHAAIEALLGAPGGHYYHAIEARRGNLATYASFDEHEVDLAGPDDTTRRVTISSMGLRWHADGFVRAVLEVPRDWPPVVCGLMTAALHGEVLVATAPIILPAMDGRATLAAWAGEPTPALAPRCPLRIPAASAALVFAH